MGKSFSDSFQTRLPRPLSDHFPISLESAKLETEKVPFKFENMWLEAEGFSDLVNKWWEEVEIDGFANFTLARKLVSLKKS